MNISQLSNVTNAATALSNLILVSPKRTVGYQPQNTPSYAKDTSKPPAALLFNYEGEQTASLESDITDHYIEDNSAIQDQIALKPVMITTGGFVGELNDVAPAALQPLKIVADKLTSVSGYIPQLSPTALLAYNRAFQLYQVGLNIANAAVGAWSTVGSLISGDRSGGQAVINGSSQLDPKSVNRRTQTQQQIFFQQFYGYWQSRTLFTIQTPWAIFQDMSILKLRSVQDPETRMISSFEVTFKQLRFASTLTVVTVSRLDPNKFQTRGTSSAAPQIDLGTSTLTASPLSFSSQLVG